MIDNLAHLSDPFFFLENFGAFLLECACRKRKKKLFIFLLKKIWKMDLTNYRLRSKKQIYIPLVQFFSVGAMTNDEEEIRLFQRAKAVFQMERNKAPGPNGFPAEFYQTFWEEKIDKLVVPTTGFANESCGYYDLNYSHLFGCGIGSLPFKYLGIPMTHRRLRNSEWQSTNKIGGLGVANLAIKNNGKWQEILKNKYFGSKSLTQIQGENVLVNDYGIQFTEERYEGKQ
ncbi:hypothetical protein ACJX0J_028122, partial [Zea mays]